MEGGLAGLPKQISPFIPFVSPPNPSLSPPPPSFLLFSLSPTLILHFFKRTQMEGGIETLGTKHFQKLPKRISP